MLALAAVGGCYVAVANSLAQVVARHDLARGHQLAPGDGRIAARLSAVRFVSDDSAGARADAARLARRALERDPTAVQAVTTLGLLAQVSGDVAAARRHFNYAQILSRRDFPTQLWAIEDAVGRGDVRDAVRHYDIALRTSKTAPDILYPVLAGAINDPAVRAAVLARLQTKPVWSLNFINYVSLGDALPQAVAALFVDLRQAGIAIPDPATTAVINRLISADAIAAAWRYYAAIRGVTDPARSRDPGFITAVQAPSVFDWMPTNDAGMTASIERSDTGGIFSYAVSPGSGGIVLQQQQLLPPGRYRLDGHGADIDEAPDALPYWILTCRDGRELGRVRVPAAVGGSNPFGGNLIVPPDCPMQTLALVARPSDRVGGGTGKIDHVMVRRAQ